MAVLQDSVGFEELQLLLQHLPYPKTQVGHAIM